MAIKRHIQQYALAESLSDPWAISRPAAVRNDWSVSAARVRNVAALLVVPYLTCGTGATGVNLDILFEVKERGAQLKLPMMAVGEWNNMPPEVCGLSWAQQWNLVDKLPADVTATCKNGGRLIDFVMVSDTLAPSVEFKPVLDVD